MKSRTLPHANQNLFKDLPMKLAPFVALTLACGTATARDVGQIPANSDPKISTWFRTAKSPSGTACCDEADGYREGVPVRVAGGEPTVIFRSWWVASDGYHLSLVDPSDLRSVHLIWDGPVVRDNPTGGAVVWLSRENGIVNANCRRDRNSAVMFMALAPGIAAPLVRPPPFQHAVPAGPITSSASSQFP